MDSATRLIAAIRQTFPDAAATTDDALISQLTNDPKDRHVLAAAISTGSSLIVTFIVRHFREHDLRQHHITTMTPDTFLQRLLHNHREAIVDLLGNQAAGLKRNPTTVADVLRRLGQHVPGFVRAMRSHVVDER
jgi:hypothetical protein